MDPGRILCNHIKLALALLYISVGKHLYSHFCVHIIFTLLTSLKNMVYYAFYHTYTTTFRRYYENWKSSMFRLSFHFTSLLLDTHVSMWVVLFASECCADVALRSRLRILHHDNERKRRRRRWRGAGRRAFCKTQPGAIKAGDYYYYYLCLHQHKYEIYFEPKIAHRQSDRPTDHFSLPSNFTTTHISPDAHSSTADIHQSCASAAVPHLFKGTRNGCRYDVDHGDGDGDDVRSKLIYCRMRQATKHSLNGRSRYCIGGGFCRSM